MANKKNKKFEKRFIPNKMGSMDTVFVPRKMTLEEKLIEKIKEKRPRKGMMKGLKRKPKPGSYDYQLQETMKPIYKTPPAMKKGELVNRPGVAPKKPNGLGVPDKFKKFKPVNIALPKEAKKLGSAALKAAKATRVGKIAAGVAGAGLAAIEYLKSKRKKMQKEREKKGNVQKKMGGGLTEATRRLRAQGLRTGGMCRGMGAALRGGNFKGVK